jgi:cysteate synthase
MAAFDLQCTACGRRFPGEGHFRTRCDNELDGHHEQALLEPAYESERLRLKDDLPGVFRFIDWLPTGDFFLETGDSKLAEPYCYRSQGLADRLGLKNLFVAFSGYWPERGVFVNTRTFKEFEVQASIAYYLQAFRERGAPAFIISSAGNTANSYNYYCHLLGLPLYLIVPETGIANLLLPFETNPVLVAVKGDYSDAIALTDRVTERLGLVRDGGAFNPARRAGMATPMLNAVVHPTQGTGRLFDHYFQAVGSASGAIAAAQAVRLLRRDGRFGENITRIHLAQNFPFTPIGNAWRARSRALLQQSEDEAHRQVASVTAAVLTNRNPPLGVAGGIYDVLEESNGCVWDVTNSKLFHASQMFRHLEGVDIGPAASVAVDALCQAVREGEVRPEDFILLHITGGGREVQYVEGHAIPTKPLLTVSPHEIDRVVDAIGTPKFISAEQIRKTLRSVQGVGAGSSRVA